MNRTLGRVFYTCVMFFGTLLFLKYEYETVMEEIAIGQMTMEQEYLSMLSGTEGE